MLNTKQQRSAATITLAPGRSSEPSLLGRRWRVGEVCVSFDADGALRFETDDGRSLSPGEILVFRKRNTAAVIDLLYEGASIMNATVDSAFTLHRGAQAPAPGLPPASAYLAARPKAPALLAKPYFFWRFVRPEEARRIDQHNHEALCAHHEQLRAWEDERRGHDQRQEEYIAAVASGDIEAVFGELLRRIDWPHETEVAYDVRGDALSCRVGLLGLSSFPSARAEASPVKLKVCARPFGDLKKRSLYVNYVHGALFRVVAEAFRIPGVNTVVASGECLLTENGRSAAVQTIISVRIDRSQWAHVNFATLPGEDMAKVMEGFELRRKMLVGAFAAVEPFTLDNQDEPFGHVA